MKARVKATGEIIDVSRYTGVMDDTNQRIYNWYEIETVDAHFTDNYWEKLLHQYAGMAMQGILSNPEVDLDYKSDECMPQAVAATAYNIAHALIEKLKEKEERK